MINCPFCGKLTDPKLDACVHCGITRKSGVAGEDQGRPRSQTCPNCGAFVQMGDIICVSCGTNLLTGQRISEQKGTPVQSAPEVVPPPKGRSRLLVGLVVAAILLTGAVIAAYFLTRDPVLKAEQLALHGRPDEASALLKAFIEKKPDNARAHFTLGKLQWNAGDFNAAASSFGKASKADAYNKNAPFMAAISLASAADPNLMEVSASLDEYVRRDPGNIAGWLLLSLTRGAQGDFDTMAKALDSAAVSDPSNAQVTLLRGVAKALKGDRSALSSINTDAQADAEQLAVRAFMAATLGEIASAGANIQKAVAERSSLHARVLTLSALTLLQEQRFVDAEAQLKQALTSLPGDPAAKFYLAVCMDAQGFGSDALADFESVAGGDSPYAAMASTMAARVLLKNGQGVRALEFAEKAITLGADDAVTHTVRGQVFAATGDFSRARDSLRRALKSDPGYAPARLELGLIDIQRSELSDAIRELSVYLETIDPELPDARVQEITNLVRQLEGMRDSGELSDSVPAPAPLTPPAPANIGMPESGQPAPVGPGQPVLQTPGQPSVSAPVQPGVPIPGQPTATTPET